MSGYWQIRYEPHLWWALNNGICCFGDTIASLISDIAAVVAVNMTESNNSEPFKG